MENDEGYYCDCTVEAGSLAILSYTGGDRNDPESIYSFTTTLGGELPPIPAFDAWESTREVTLHVETAEGEDTVVYTVPGDWEFMVYFADDFTLYDSETQTEPLYENIPGDGQNHELWASNAVG